jgi:restriction system protein
MTGLVLALILLATYPKTTMSALVVVLAALGARKYQRRVARQRQAQLLQAAQRHRTQLVMAEQLRRAQLERTVSHADTLSAPEFEQYVARLMRASGCHEVVVSGGAGDLGADVVGYAPDGRRVVVQCKRYTRAGRALSSPDVQTFAGTAHTVHHADVALLVTTGRSTQPARQAARRTDITLIDREALAQWISCQRISKNDPRRFRES